MFKTAKARLLFVMLLAFVIVPASKAHAQPAAAPSETTVGADTDPVPTHPPVIVTKTDDDDDDDCCAVGGTSPEPPC